MGGTETSPTATMTVLQSHIFSLFPFKISPIWQGQPHSHLTHAWICRRLRKVRLLFRVTTCPCCKASSAIAVPIVYLLFLQPSYSRNGMLVWYAFMIFAGVIATLLSVSFADSTVILGTSFGGTMLAEIFIAYFISYRHTTFDPVVTTSSPMQSTVPSPCIPLPHPDSFAKDMCAVVYASFIITLAIFDAMTQYRIAPENGIVATYTRQHRQRKNTLRIAGYDDASVVVPVHHGSNANTYTNDTLVKIAFADVSSLQMLTNFDKPSQFLHPLNSNDWERVLTIKAFSFAPTANSISVLLLNVPARSASAADHICIASFWCIGSHIDTIPGPRFSSVHTTSAYRKVKSANLYKNANNDTPESVFLNNIFEIVPILV